MATLHIFNPEHDIALAYNLANFTAPHAARQLRCDIGFLPALWAEDDDVVMTDNEETAAGAWKKIRARLHLLWGEDRMKHVNPRFVTWKSVKAASVDSVEPWGWDAALVAQLKRKGIAGSLLPSEEKIAEIRLLSHRRTAARLLPELLMAGTVGEAFECSQQDEVEALLGKHNKVVMKAPWSSSGRGLRFLDVARTPFSMQAGWFFNTVDQQGSVMVEPYYNKVKDFGMEFSVDENGETHYVGLSLFHTVNGIYRGNIIATERRKMEMMGNYLPVDLLTEVKQRICDKLGSIMRGKYVGPLGVDMMVVAREDAKGFLLHPCVEVNMRRTMGHVAIALTPDDDDIVRVMRIELTDHYKLKINKL